MDTKTTTIRDAALALPEEERLTLADLLYESVDTDKFEVADDPFFAELQRRRQEVDETIPWSELKQKR